MKVKQTFKRILDLVLIILLPVLMAEIYTGQEAHEWLGVGMAVCFLVHIVLNAAWIKSLFKGEYSPARGLMTAINLLLCADVLALLISGVMMSGFAFSWLNISGGKMLARKLHLFASYWGMISMSAHLGLNWGVMMNAAKKPFRIEKKNAVRTWILRGIAIAVSGFGIYSIFSQKIYDYLFLRTHFVMFDETKSTFVFLLETTAMMGLFAAAFYYLQKVFTKIKSADKAKKAFKPAAIAAPLAVCLAVVIGFNSGKSTVPVWAQGEPSDVSNTEQSSPAVSNDASIPTASTGNSTSGIPQSQPSSTPGVDSTGNSTPGIPQSQPSETSGASAGNSTHGIPQSQPSDITDNKDDLVSINDGFVMIKGGSFKMGSPESEAWRSNDETQHTVTVSDFYISPFELTQKEYSEITGKNPSSFKGGDLPVENVSWMDAVLFCNAYSEKAGLTPVYTVNGNNISWNRSANGYRLPTEAEWEYACRAGTTTPFNTENSPSAEEANYYGHYPYMIEGNYFTQENLETKPGTYRQTTLAVNSFEPNKFGLYNMHGNVSEWVWDHYGRYGNNEIDPTGAETGILRVYRGGGWNDFAKNMRSAYRATMPQDKGSFNIGIRLVRNAAAGNGIVIGVGENQNTTNGGKTLIAYFSWGGNTRGAAREIQRQTGADLFEIQLVDPYSDDYSTVLDEAQHDQNIQARPEIANHVENFSQYDTILIGYPNWWASIPMPIASFLEEYDFSGKTIIPFCSHGGGRFGQSITAIAKLAPDSTLGEGLSIHYSGGSALSDDVADWLRINNIQ